MVILIGILAEDGWGWNTRVFHNWLNP